MTFNLPIAQIDAAQLETLRADAIREGRQLEYKERLPGNSDEDKREFLSDVTSFANAAGGDLIFGLRERRGDEGKPTAAFDRDIVAPPEIMLSDFATSADVLLHPPFDFVWNGGGWSGSPNYRDGRWFTPS